MNKKQYINNLKELLLEKNVTNEDISVIIEDYEELYDEALNRGLSNEEIYSQLGDTEFVYNQLKHDLNYIKANENKIVSLSPFIALIIFFVLGFAFDLWNYSWLAFLLIPIIAVIVNVRGTNKIIALSPFVSVIVYYLLGMIFGLWHPGWLIFFIIPISGILINTKGKEVLYGLGVFFVIISFVTISFVSGETWKYNLLILLAIPLFTYIFNYKKRANLVGASLMLFAIVGYIMLLQSNVLFEHAIFIFIIPIIFAIFNGNIKITIINNHENSKFLMISFLVILATYFGISLVFGYWNLTWLILLLIPMTIIYSTEKFKHLVAFTPFIATILFILVGHFFNAWQYAWMIYLIIPMTGILEGDKGEKSPYNDENIE